MRLILSLISLVSLAMANTTPAEEPAVSFHREIIPILKRNCNGCHRPGKSKGGLDLTTFATIMKGGKHGVILKGGAPQRSELVDQVSGEDPEMPKDNEPLTAQEIALLTHWITQGARDDTPAGGGSRQLPAPPAYTSLPSIPALAYAPSGDLLAVAGYHEVLLRSGDGVNLVGRLIGESPRIESLAFSPDGKQLAASGGSPSEYGEIQLWDVAERKLIRSIKTTTECVYGVSFSPDGTRVAVGCADKTVRAFTVANGREVMKCDNHVDWVFATAFSQDGVRLVSVSRDKAVKLIDVATGRLIDDVSKPRDPMTTLARHPREDLMVCGDEKGAVRVYKMIPRAGRLKEGDDKEEGLIRELERLSGSVQSLAYSSDGEWIAAAGLGGDAKIYKAADGKRGVTLKTSGAPLFAIAFDPKEKLVVASGFDGKLRFFDPATGAEVRAVDAVPLTAGEVSASASR
jgi:hypothetical protein